MHNRFHFKQKPYQGWCNNVGTIRLMLLKVNQHDTSYLLHVVVGTSGSDVRIQMDDFDNGDMLLIKNINELITRGPLFPGSPGFPGGPSSPYEAKIEKVTD